MPKNKNSKSTELTQSEEELKAEKKREKLNFASDSFASKPLSAQRPMAVTRKQVQNYLKNPLQNYNELQKASWYLKSYSGNYYRIIKYFSTMLTYYYFLYPAMTDDKINQKDKLQKSFMDTALFIDKLNVKYNFQWITERLMESGEIYLYKLEDTKGIVFKEIPTGFCRISLVEDGVFLYEVDFSKFDDKTILDFPVEFQNLYLEYKNSKTTNKKDKDTSSDPNEKNWIQISNKGVAFNVSGMTIHGIPPFCFVFDDIMALEENKDMQADVNKLDNLKLIHQKIPTNKDTGEPLLEPDEARTYHEATKKNLPKGVAITTNPLDMEAITLNKAAAQQNDMVTQSKSNIWDNIGISSLLFANDKATGETLKRSVITDESIMFSILTMFANYINSQIKKSVNSVYYWKIKFLDVTHFTKDDKWKMAREDLAYGGSRLLYFAYQGLSPLEAINILKSEQTMGIIDLLVPAQSSYTTSGDDTGRPTTDNPTASAEKTRENK